MSRLARELNDPATSEGLTPSQASVLAVVASRSPIGLRELIDVERINPTMMSRVLTKLEMAGFVRRFPSETDQRAVIVEATVAGVEVNDRIRAGRTEQLLDSIARLSAEDAIALGNAVDALEALVDQVITQRQ